MKKILLFFVALAVCTSNAKAFKYESEEGFTWMGVFGMNISGLQNHPYNSKLGALMGIRTDYMLPYAHGAYVTAGLDWTMKGGKLSALAPLDNGAVYDATAKYNLHYLEIPIRVGFRYNITEAIGVYGEVGPYFAIGVGGRHKTRLDGDGADVRDFEDDYTFKAFKNTEDLERPTFQRWDAGIGFRVGVEYNEHYNLMFGCDWGLTDMYRNSLRDAYFTQNGERLTKVHNFNFSITAGYRF